MRHSVVQRRLHPKGSNFGEFCQPFRNSIFRNGFFDFGLLWSQKSELGKVTWAVADHGVRCRGGLLRKKFWWGVKSSTRSTRPTSTSSARGFSR